MGQDIDPQPKRPALLIPMYIATASLNGLDVHSTLLSLDRGHREGNPLLGSGRPAVLIGAKVASTAFTVWMTERLWKKNRVGAVLVMVGVNAGLSAVVVNNYRIAGLRNGRPPS